MNFMHHDLGYQRGGEIVQVTLEGNAANVLLLDTSNFSSYKAGRQYRHYGCHAKESPVRLKIPLRWALGTSRSTSADTLVKSDPVHKSSVRLTRGAVTGLLRSAPWARCRSCGPAGRQEAYFGVHPARIAKQTTRARHDWPMNHRFRPDPVNPPSLRGSLLEGLQFCAAPLP